MPRSPNSMPSPHPSLAGDSAAEVASAKLIVCHNCKRQKRKCDRQQPSCARCQQAGLSCEYGQERKRPGPAKGAVNSRTRDLLDRINQLEGMVQALSESHAAQTAPTPYLSLDLDPSVAWPSAGSATSLDWSPPSDATLGSSIQTQSITPWPVTGIETTDVLQGAATPSSDEMGGLSAIDLLPATEQLLTSLYFEHIQPTFPMFRKPVFYQDLISHQIPDMLLTAMFAISSRFLPTSKVHELFGDITNPWDRFSHTAHRIFRKEMRGNDPVTLTHVKVACLLALYEYTKTPSRQAWILVSNAVRLALMAQLHQVDCLDPPASVSVGELEERRFVWWTVWRLDCTVNVTACTPFGIDRQMIGTGLVTTTVENFTAGLVEDALPVIAEMDPIKFWTCSVGPELRDAGDGFNTHLFATGLLRAVSECQQRLNIRPSPEDIKQVAALDDILSSLHLILPDWFFGPNKYPTEDFHCHRLRLETIIMLNTTRLIAHEPVRQLIMTMGLSSDSRTVSLKSWRDSISSAESIAQVLDQWPVDYFALADPIISCAIWHAYCGLALYNMSGLESSRSGSKASMEGTLESLRSSLERFTTWWPIARVLQDSLQIVRGWSWATIDIHKLVDLISHTRKALSPYSSEPGSVDAGLICDAIL